MEIIFTSVTWAGWFYITLLIFVIGQYPAFSGGMKRTFKNETVAIGISLTTVLTLIFSIMYYFVCAVNAIVNHGQHVIGGQ